MQDSKFIFSLKDGIWFVGLVVSVMGVYFKMDNKLSTTHDKVMELQSKIDRHDISVMDYRLGEVQKQVGDMKTTLDKVYTMISRNREERHQ